MGFLSDIFGGTDDSAQKAQISANERTQEFIEEQTALARGDALGLYPYGDRARNQSYSAALELLGASIPEQMRMFQEGNLGAQRQLSAAAPQYRNAILGLPVDYRALQPSAVNYADMFNVKAPRFGPTPAFPTASPGRAVTTNSSDPYAEERATAQDIQQGIRWRRGFSPMGLIY